MVGATDERSIRSIGSRITEPCKHSRRCAGPVIRKSQFESGTGLQPGKAQRSLSTRPIIERSLVRPQLPGPIFKCGQVNRCHAGLISHASGVQLASPQPFSWGSRSMGGPLACNQQMRVRFPPLPPSSPGRPLRSRRRSEKPDKHVRLVLLAPSVTVAEWLRRQTVDLSTRVQFPPVTPVVRASFNG